MYCAVNVVAYAFGETYSKALDNLCFAMGVKTYGDKERYRYLLRVYKMSCRPKMGWRFYCPQFGMDQNGVLEILEDNMRDWEDGELPLRMTVENGELKEIKEA